MTVSHLSTRRQHRKSDQLALRRVPQTLVGQPLANFLSFFDLAYPSPNKQEFVSIVTNSLSLSENRGRSMLPGWLRQGQSFHLFVYRRLHAHATMSVGRGSGS